MSNTLNEMQQLRLLFIKWSNFDLVEAEKMYDFVINERPKKLGAPVVKDDSKKLGTPVIKDRPDGIYFILSPNNIIHESSATDEDKRNSIAVGVKMGNRFANVVLHDAVGGEEIALCQEDKVPCGSKQFFHNTFWKAMSDWNGEANTNDMRSMLNPDINLGENEYIPSVAQLQLILLNIKEINKALEEAGGDPMKDDWYWSSTEISSTNAWSVYFSNGGSYTDSKYTSYVIRPSLVCEF